MKRTSTASRLFVLIGVLAIASAIPLSQARACSGFYNNLCTEIANSHVIFAGHAVSVVPGPAVAHEITARLAVFDRFKGTVADTVDVVTSNWQGTCGFPFVAGNDFLVFAFRSGPLFHTHLCTLTRGFWAGDPILPLLRLPCTTPVEAATWTRVKGLRIE